MLDTDNGHAWLTFDCFGTLVDWDQGIRQSAELLFPGRGAELLTAYGQHEERLRLHEPFRRYRDVLTEGLRRACDDLRLALNSDDADFLAHTIPYWPVFNDVAAALGELRGAGWRLALLTNCDRDIIGQTQRRLGVSVDVTVTAEDVRAYKPMLAHFERFAASVAPRCWIHVAQSHVIDIQPAHRLNLPSVWINRAEDPHDPSLATAVLTGLSDLPRTLTTLDA